MNNKVIFSTLQTISMGSSLRNLCVHVLRHQLCIQCSEPRLLHLGFPIFSMLREEKALTAEATVVRAGAGKRAVLSEKSPPLLCQVEAWQLVGVLLQLK